MALRSLPAPSKQTPVVVCALNLGTQKVGAGKQTNTQGFKLILKVWTWCVKHAYNPEFPETEAEGLPGVLGQPGLHSKTLSLKKKKFEELSETPTSTQLPKATGEKLSFGDL